MQHGQSLPNTQGRWFQQFTLWQLWPLTMNIVSTRQHESQLWERLSSSKELSLWQARGESIAMTWTDHLAGKLQLCDGTLPLRATTWIDGHVQKIHEHENNTHNTPFRSFSILSVQVLKQSAGDLICKAASWLKLWRWAFAFSNGPWLGDRFLSGLQLHAMKLFNF